MHKAHPSPNPPLSFSSHWKPKPSEGALCLTAWIGSFILSMHVKKTSLFTFEQNLSLGDDVGGHDVVLVLGETGLTWHRPCALDRHLPKTQKHQTN